MLAGYDLENWYFNYYNYEGKEKQKWEKQAIKVVIISLKAHKKTNDDIILFKN